MTAVTAYSLNWMLLGACTAPDVDPLVFFGPEGEADAEREEREHRAKRVCSGCMVIASCLEYALKVRPQHGVYGGLGEEERRVYRATATRRARGQRRPAA
jgi:WhiB family redox-sensing transcriptional regulator